MQATPGADLLAIPALLFVFFNRKAVYWVHCAFTLCLTTQQRFNPSFPAVFVSLPCRTVETHLTADMSLAVLSDMSTAAASPSLSEPCGGTEVDKSEMACGKKK